MATVNGNEVDFEGISYVEIGELLLELSGTQDGSGLAVYLTEEESSGFMSDFETFDLGLVLADLVLDAVEKKTGKRPVLRYQTQNDLEADIDDDIFPLTKN